MWNLEAYDLAEPYLDEARRGPLPPVLGAENLRLLGIALYRLSDRRRARATLNELFEHPGSTLGLREEARDWLERLDWEEGRPIRARRAL